MTPDGLITTVAGDGTPGYSGDGGPATAAELNDPSAVAVDGTGDLFIADTYNSVIREVTPSGVINNVAGDGTPGYSNDGGSANAAELGEPYGLALDAQGDLFIADGANSVVRRVGLNATVNVLVQTTTSVNISRAVSASGQAVTLNATVEAQVPGGPWPTGGTVTFYDGSTAPWVRCL